MASKKINDIEKFKKEIKEESRPWGKFRTFPYKQARNIKIITVNPGETLSLQFHHYRSEFWVVLDKGLEVTVGKKVWQPEQDEEIYVPKKGPHRLRCLGPKKARVMEIWMGDSDESDIVRLDDEYGRS